MDDFFNITPDQEKQLIAKGGLEPITAPKPEQKPSVFWEGTKISFEDENIISQVFRKNYGVDETLDINYNYEADFDNDQYREFLDVASQEVFNQEQSQDLKRRIDESRNRRDVLSQAGQGAAFLGGILGAFASPENYLPFLGWNKSAKLITNIGKLAAGNALSETALQTAKAQNDPLWTIEEGATAVAGSVIFSAALGAVPGVYGVAKKAFGSKGADAMMNKLQNDLTIPKEGEIDPLSVTSITGGSIGAARYARREKDKLIENVNLRKQELRESGLTEDEVNALGFGRVKSDNKATTGYLKLTQWMNPVLYTKNASSEEARLVSSLLFDDATYSVLAKEGVVQAPPVEIAIKTWNQNHAIAKLEFDAAFAEYRKTAGVNLTNSPKAILTGDFKKQFSERVAIAMRNDDSDDYYALSRGLTPDPAVNKAAIAIRKNLINPLKEEAVDVGLLKKDTDIKTAASYLTRMWDKNKIISRRQDFSNIIEAHVREVTGYNLENLKNFKDSFDNFRSSINSFSSSLRESIEKAQRQTESTLGKIDNKITGANLAYERQFLESKRNQENIDKLIKSSTQKWQNATATMEANIQGAKADFINLKNKEEENLKAAINKSMLFLKEKREALKALSLQNQKPAKLDKQKEKIKELEAKEEAKLKELKAKKDKIIKGANEKLETITKKIEEKYKDFESKEAEKFEFSLQKLEITTDLKNKTLQDLEDFSKQLEESKKNPTPLDKFLGVENELLNLVDRIKNNLDELTELRGRGIVDENAFRELLKERMTVLQSTLKNLTELVEAKWPRKKSKKITSLNLNLQSLDSLIKTIDNQRTWLSKSVDEHVAIQKTEQIYLEELEKSDREAFSKKLYESFHLNVLTRYIEDTTNEIVNGMISNTKMTPLRIKLNELSPNIRGPLAERTLGIADNEVEEFLVNDIEEIMNFYTRNMAVDVEMTRTFNSPDGKEALERIAENYDQKLSTLSGKEYAELLKEKNKVLRALTEGVELMRGTSALTGDPESILVRGSTIGRQLTYLAYMGASSLAQIPEFGKLVMTHGVTRVFGDLLTPLVTNTKAIGLIKKDVRANTGAIVESVLHSRLLDFIDSSEQFIGMSKFERMLKGFSNYFSKINLSTFITEFTKDLDSIIRYQNLLEDSNLLLAGKLSDKRKEMLANYFIDEEWAERIQAQVQKHGFDEDGRTIANLDKWDDAEAKRRFNSAIIKSTRLATSESGVGDVPLGMNTPLLKTVFQFTRFVVASNQRLALYGLQKADADTLLGLTIMGSLGSLSYVLKEYSAGREPNYDPTFLVLTGFDRAGIGGIMMEANNRFESMAGYGLYKTLGQYNERFAQRTDTSIGVLGPLGGYTGNAIKAVGALKDGQVTASEVKAARRLLPMQNLIGISFLFDEAEQGLKRTFNIPEKTKNK